MKITHKNFLMIREPKVSDFGSHKFSRLEAGIMLQQDYNTGKETSILYYARRWKWTEKRVKGFIKSMFLELIPVCPTKLKGKSRLNVTKEGILIKDLAPILINQSQNS